MIGLLAVELKFLLYHMSSVFLVVEPRKIILLI